VPEAALALLNPNDVARPVWQNLIGGLTFRVRPGRASPCTPEYEAAGGARYLKYSPASASTEVPLSAEVSRLQWAGEYIAVPKVLDFRVLPTGEEVLLTSAILGRSAVDPYWKARSSEAATAVGKGLRQLHDALPVKDCPFSWSVADRVSKQGLTPDDAAQFQQTTPELDLVVCHGDPCVPNTILTDFGTVAGYVDLGELGVADRWADLAVAARNAEWNYGAGCDKYVYEGYGLAPNQEKIGFYLSLWDAETPVPVV
jgi:kanamycin kinase